MNDLEKMLLRPAIERALTVSTADLKAVAKETGRTLAEERKSSNAYRKLVMKKLGY